MTFAELAALAGRGISFVGHAFGVKEFLDQLWGGLSGSSRIPGLLDATKGSEEERHFMALLFEIGKMQPTYLAALLLFIHKCYIPPPHTGRIGRMGYESAHQEMMRLVLTLPPKSGQMSAKMWLMELGRRLHEGGEAIYPQIKQELEAQRFPFPPDVNFDQHVNNAYMRMNEARLKHGITHRIVRDWL